MRDLASKKPRFADANRRFFELAIENVQSAFLDVHRRLFHGFAQRRVRVSRAREIF